MSSEIITDVITKAKIPTKIFYRINDSYKAEKITTEENLLPGGSLGENHENKYYYKDGKLYLVIKNDNGEYEAEEKTLGGVLPDSLGENHIGNYYYGYEEAYLGISNFGRIWGTVEITDDEGNEVGVTINLQDAMNALYKMMTSRSHVWVNSDGSDVPGYAKLLIETDKQ
jgi:hypothetical protein